MSEHKFVFPKRLLDQLGEASLGYLLFYVNENGDIIPVPGFNNQLTAAALISFAKAFATAIEEIETQNIIDLVHNQEQDIDGDDNFDAENGEDYLP